ncbi:MAG: hypothetical protein A2Z14_02785 [Chloroflexi bacterium RBG_16_48_8]|nr:MAG: hypothetical protein A2Z14_02785 [Chloroflexi bacterium RBG_16_48_8]
MIRNDYSDLFSLRAYPGNWVLINRVKIRPSFSHPAAWELSLLLWSISRIYVGSSTFLFLPCLLAKLAQGALLL